MEYNVPLYNADILDTRNAVKNNRSEIFYLRNSTYVSVVSRQKVIRCVVSARAMQLQKQLPRRCHIPFFDSLHRSERLSTKEEGSFSDHRTYTDLNSTGKLSPIVLLIILL